MRRDALLCCLLLAALCLAPAAWAQKFRMAASPDVKALDGCRREQLDYRGVIYAGLMIGKDGPRVLEFNVRFGDPETQAVLMRLDSDLLEAMTAVTDRRLDEVTLQWSDDAAACVVMAAGGYPGEYRKGDVI
ncbi:MAG: phosphoribosylamine--glycine ligase, partial [Desulfovibrionaceae bacterium]